MRHQPNSVLHRDDGISQLSSLVGLRATLPHFYPPSPTTPQLFMRFTDLHQSNFFVDDDWHITRLIDLDFAYSSPLELSHVPSWLTDLGVDQIDPGPVRDDYQTHYDAFVDAVAAQEDSSRGRELLPADHTYSAQLRADWTSGRLWYSMALGSLNAFPTIWVQHFRPRFFPDWKFETHTGPLAQLWGEDLEGFLAKKAAEMEQYQEKVKEVFEMVAGWQREEQEEVVVVQEENVVKEENVVEEENVVKG